MNNKTIIHTYLCKVSEEYICVLYALQKYQDGLLFIFVSSIVEYS